MAKSEINPPFQWVVPLSSFVGGCGGSIAGSNAHFGYAYSKKLRRPPRGAVGGKT
ncbi:MAG: hypothetical protein AB7F91_15430 [Parvularculaceae bacterium]